MSMVGARTVHCGYCRRTFAEDVGQPACRACPLGEACHAIRCPHCGYENPVEPRWLNRFTTWIRDHGPRRLD